MPFDIAPKAGDWEVIAEVEVEADCDYVEFTGLDINSDKAYVIFIVRKNPLSVDDALKMYVNGDTDDANYYVQYILAHETTIGGDRLNFASTGTSTANTADFRVIFLTLDTNGYARAIIFTNKDVPSSVDILLIMWAKATTETNITTIRFQASNAGGIGAGSKFILCRVKRP